MGKKNFNKQIQRSHAKLMKWAESNNIRFVMKGEKEREERNGGRGRGRRY